MKLNNLFYDSSVNLSLISKKRFITSVVIGLFSAFLIYTAFYVFRESFRLMSFSFANTPNIVSEANRKTYNLFFAFLSVIFGNSIAINFLLNRPQKAFSRRNMKRKRIINDQFFLNFNFAYWLGKIGLMFGIFSINMLDFQFLPFSYTPMILLIIVMYLETWKTLILVLGRKKYKYLLIHFFLVSMLSFGLSRVELLDYKKIDENSLLVNPLIDLPRSKYSDTDYRNTIYYRVEVDSNNRIQIFNGIGEKINIKKLSYEINENRKFLRSYMKRLLRIGISADKAINIKFIKEFESKLFEIGQLGVVYETYNEIYEDRRFVREGIKHEIGQPLTYFYNDKLKIFPSEISVYPEFLFKSNTFTYNDTITISIGREIKFNNEVIQPEKMTEKFINTINENIVFNYRLSDKTTYQHYINVLASHKKSIKLLRKLNQKVELEEKDFKYLNKKEYIEDIKRLSRAYPKNIVETYNFD